MLSKLNTLVKEVTENLDSYEIGVASAKVYDFIWDTYCDWYIELTKTRLNGEDDAAKLTAQNVLCYVLTELLKLLHPFMPFITEEIFQALPQCDGAEEISDDCPSGRSTAQALDFPAEESCHGGGDGHHQAPSAARRAEMNVPPSKKAELLLVTGQPEIVRRRALHFLQRLAYASEVTFCGDRAGGCHGAGHRGHPQRHGLYAPQRAGGSGCGAGADCQGAGKGAETACGLWSGKLANEKFVAQAPEAVVNAEREKAAKYRDLIAKLEESAKAMA